NPSPSAASGSVPPGGYLKTTNTQDNAIGNITKTIDAAPGSVRTLSVAVLLDKNAPAVNQAQIQQLVSSAVGLNPKRGDTIALASAPFDQTAAKQAADAAAKAAHAAATARSAAARMSRPRPAAGVRRGTAKSWSA